MHAQRSSLQQYQYSDNTMADRYKRTSTESIEGSGHTSSLLHDLLREKKAESRHVSNVYNVDSREPRRNFNEYDGRKMQSSPPPPPKRGEAQAKHSRKPSWPDTRHSSGTREMGARETEEHISKLNKQNFDLKLEVYQRRQRAEAMDAKLEKMKSLESENKELQDINDELVKELEKRDQAIKEAVNIICELENKVERIQLAMRDPSPPTAMPPIDHSKDGYSPPSSPPFQSSPTTPQASTMIGKSKHTTLPGVSSTFRLVDDTTPSPSKTGRRVPSFLRDAKGSTNALRSLYLSDENLSKIALSTISLPRPGSFLSWEDNTNDLDPFDCSISSPRQSILSESDFLSVYGDTRRVEADQQDDGDLSIEEQKRSVQDEPKTLLDRQIHRSTKTSRHVAERLTPTKPSGTSSKNAARKNYTLIDKVINAQSHFLTDPVPRDTPTGEHLDHTSHNNTREKEKKLPSLTEKMGAKDLLPPTPDTITPLPSEGRNDPTHSIIAEKRLPDGTTTPARGFLKLLSTPRPRPMESHVRQPSLNDSQADVVSTNAGLLDSDDEKESTRAEQSEYGDEAAQEALTQASTFMGGSFQSVQGSGGKASNRPLKTYGTDMMFNGEGIQEKYPPQSSIHPYPISAHCHQSAQYPWPEYPPVSRNETAPTQPLPPVRRTVSSATALPTRRTHLDRAESWSASHEEYETASPSDQQSDDGSPDTNNASLPQPSWPRLENPKIARTGNAATHKTLVSRIFRRSVSHNAPSILDTGSGKSSSNPPLTHAPSSNITRSTKPRPVSAYFPTTRSPSTYTDHSTGSHNAPSIIDMGSGNNSSNPPSTHAPSSTHVPSSNTSTRTTKHRPLSAHIPTTRSSSTYTDHSSTTTSSKIARPGTGGSQESTLATQTYQPHRHATSYHDNTSSSGERINTPGTEHSDPVAYGGQENLTIGGREGPRPESQEAGRGSSDEDRGSRFMGKIRRARGSVDEGQGGKKWGMGRGRGIGRSASLRIREGLGRKRAER